MKLSAQEEYGLRCLLYMARSGSDESRSIPEISRAEGLSIPNVAKLMRLLRLGGFVDSVRGQAGGYTLARPPEEIIVGDVMDHLGGSFFASRFCERHAGTQQVCVHKEDCAVRCLWNHLNGLLQSILGKATLRDLLTSEPEMTHWLASGNGNGAAAAGHKPSPPRRSP